MISHPQFISKWHNCLPSPPTPNLQRDNGDSLGKVQNRRGVAIVATPHFPLGFPVETNHKFGMFLFTHNLKTGSLSVTKVPSTSIRSFFNKAFLMPWTLAELSSLYFLMTSFRPNPVSTPLPRLSRNSAAVPSTPRSLSGRKPCSAPTAHR